jgi:type I restriction enzyme, R subunit
MGSFRESFVEQAALAWLESARSSVKNRAEIAPSDPAAERDDYGQVVLARLNPALPAEALEDAFRKLTRPDIQEATA